MKGHSKHHEADIKIAEGLEHGSVHPAHKKGLVNGLGGKQPVDPAPSGESNHETLRHGSKPKIEMVRNMPVEDKGAQKKAHGYTMRSQAGKANPMAYPKP